MTGVDSYFWAYLGCGLSWKFRLMALDSFGARKAACMVWLEGEGMSVLRDFLEGKKLVDSGFCGRRMDV